VGASSSARCCAKQGCARDVVVSEAETLFYASRSDGTSQARILRTKD
jgi:hypothetical protein